MSIEEVETILFAMLGRKQKQISFSKRKAMMLFVFLQMKMTLMNLW